MKAEVQRLQRDINNCGPDTDSDVDATKQEILETDSHPIFYYWDNVTQMVTYKLL